jgi:hypothetical protein
MTRTTVYQGQPWDDDHEVLADLFHNHDDDSRKNRAVTIETTGGQEFHIPEDEAVDIYVDGTPVDED